LLRRVVGAFADMKAVEQDVLKAASDTTPMADELRIRSDGMLRKTVLTRSLPDQRVA